MELYCQEIEHDQQRKEAAISELKVRGSASLPASLAVRAHPHNAAEGYWHCGWLYHTMLGGGGGT